MDQDTSITKLLRLKRYEQPPPGYFEDFLAEFQVRQRAEVIHRPFFKIAWDRFSSVFVMPPVPRLALASSFAAAVLATGLVFFWAQDETESLPTSVASTEVLSQKAAGPVQYVLPARPVCYASARRF
jgi:hypothetical protein